MPHNVHHAHRSVTRFFLLLIVVLLGSSLLFFTLNVNGQWDFALTLRAQKWFMMMTVAYAIGISTLLFQTLTHNPILTPSLLGYDALYMLLQTVLVMILGAVGYNAIASGYKFAFEVPLMVAASLLLFSSLMRKSEGDLSKLILIGVIFGVLFRSTNSLLQRMMDPLTFINVQINYFAQFTSVNLPLLYIGMGVMLINAFWVWRIRYQLDVLLLGRNSAIELGVHYQRTSLLILIWVAILVCVATALVGPVVFFGLLVCAMVNALAPSMKHAIRLPAVFLMAGIILVLGQTIFEQLLGMKAVLGVVVEFLGGLVFLWLILFRKRR